MKRSMLLVLFGFLMGSIAMGIVGAAVVVSRMEAFSNSLRTLEKVNERLLNQRTGKVAMEAMDPDFMRGFWLMSDEIRQALNALGSTGYNPDGSGLYPIPYNWKRAFETKLASAQLLVKTRGAGDPTALSLLLTAMSERGDLKVFGCRADPEIIRINLPTNLLPLLEGSLYSVKVVPTTKSDGYLYPGYQTVEVWIMEERYTRQRQC